MVYYNYPSVFKESENNRARKHRAIVRCLNAGFPPERLIPLAMAWGIPAHEFNTTVYWSGKDRAYREYYRLKRAESEDKNTKITRRDCESILSSLREDAMIAEAASSAEIAQEGESNAGNRTRP